MGFANKHFFLFSCGNLESREEEETGGGGGGAAAGGGGGGGVEVEDEDVCVPFLQHDVTMASVLDPDLEKLSKLN